jgi:hypothetical protein
MIALETQTAVGDSVEPSNHYQRRAEFQEQPIPPMRLLFERVCFLDNFGIDSSQSGLPTVLLVLE